MEIHYSKTFQKHFKKRVPRNSSLEKRYKQRLTLFLKDKKNPILKDHKLIGKKKNFRSFSITGDFRVIYKEELKDVVILIDVGTHNQIYSQK